MKRTSHDASGKWPQELYRRYDLVATRAEAQADLVPENEQRRLLKQSEIAARFRKRQPLRSGGGK
jgi:hypothetical protein